MPKRKIKSPAYDLSQTGAVTTVRISPISAGWCQWLLLMSDNHYDSIACNRDLMTEHLEEARRREAMVMVFGDFFDAMQGRFDPRRSMDELRPEYRREDYYDYVVQDATQYLLPYNDNLLVISDGNHELSVLKNANTNLCDRLVHGLRMAGSAVQHGGYGGWIRFAFDVSGDGPRFSKNLKYFHGAGADAPVTRGVIWTNRQAVYLPDADIVVNGHSHHAYYVPISRERLTNGGRQYMDIQHHIRTPGYKQSYGDGSKGWDITRGAPPKPIGAAWVRLEYKQAPDRVDIVVMPDVRGGDVISVVDDLYDGVAYDDDRELA